MWDWKTWDLKIPKIDGYTYIMHLSSGGQGDVHLIKKLGQTFVAKVVPKLSDEAFALMSHIADLHISNTPKISELINTQDETIIIREYIEGITLLEDIETKGPMSLERAKAIILKICETLKAFHHAKPHPIIYRDLKPDNIIITPKDEVYIIDFGIVRYYKQEAIRDTIAIGTEGYTAPEIMAGMQSDARSDIYSIGLVFYEMLTGKNLLVPPYQIRPVTESDVLLPTWLDILIEKATGMSVVTRFSNIEAFVDALNQPKRLYKKRRKYRVVLGALGIIAFGMVGWFVNDALSNKKVETVEYDMLLSLDFEDEADSLWVMGYENPESEFGFVDGELAVYKGCNIGYTPSSGAFVHFQNRSGSSNAVSLGPYRLNTDVAFECIYEDDMDFTTYTTMNRSMGGSPFKNTGQNLDQIIYVAPDNDIVYAFVIDREAEKMAYTAYQISEETADIPLYIATNNFSNGADVMYIDSIQIGEGSLQAYIEEEFKFYSVYEKRLDDLFSEPDTNLPEMVFKTMDEW